MDKTNEKYLFICQNFKTYFRGALFILIIHFRTTNNKLTKKLNL